LSVSHVRSKSLTKELRALSLEETPLDEKAREFGGKAANLARLETLGVRLAPAVGVRVAAFHEALTAAGLSASVADLDQHLREGKEVDRDSLAAIRRRLASAELPVQLKSELGDAIQEWPDARTIVRSSATVEDSASHSFAGIFDSLQVTERSQSSLIDTILAVWNSVFSERAFAYYRHAGLEAVPGMGLILQPFLEAERSGVLFTSFPAPSGAASVLVEHVEGDCAKLVTGEVDPERAWIGRWPESAAELEALPGLAPLAPSLSLELVTAARHLETTLGAPQDIEWCVAQSELTILQTRPITTGVSTAENEPVDSKVQAKLESVDLLTEGLGASGGVSSGGAHLVFNIQDADALEEGEILVTAMTNPDMVTAMQRSQAVVTDVGGMICHAAIVSRELGIPCVVGTGNATDVIASQASITVDGFSGRIYAGAHAVASQTVLPELCWSDLWTEWEETADDAWWPLLTTRAALDNAGTAVAGRTVILAPYLDLATDSSAHARPLGSLTSLDIETYIEELLEQVSQAKIERVLIAPFYLSSVADLLATACSSTERISFLDLPTDAPPGSATVSHSGETVALCLCPSAEEITTRTSSRERLAIPLSTLPFARLDREARPDGEEGDGGGAVFGTPPQSRTAPMPSSESRARWHRLLPEHARALGAAASTTEPTYGSAREKTGPEEMEYEWLDVRPEVAITPLLSSLVLPGVETIPQALGFDELPPLHTQWIRCRFHFRKDAFFPLFMNLMQATWSEPFLTRVIDRTRASYGALERTAAALPQTAEGLASEDGAVLREAFLEWWRTFVDFFSFSFFIQAQGDDFVFPAIVEAVDSNRSLVEELTDRSLLRERALPAATTFTLPTRAVQTADYMDDLGRVWRGLESAGIEDVDSALESLTSGSTPELAEAVESHLEEWGWMRERDPFFAPYDQPRDVIEKALGVRSTERPDPAAHLAATRLAASVHFELAHLSGDPVRLAYAIRFNRELVLERENHHIAWLKHSYPLRRLWLEWERRLAEQSPLQARDIFFLKAPEILEAIDRLPEGISDELLKKIRNRRRAYCTEMRLSDEEVAGPIEREDDYY